MYYFRTRWDSFDMIVPKDIIICKDKESLEEAKSLYVNGITTHLIDEGEVMFNEDGVFILEEI